MSPILDFYMKFWYMLQWLPAPFMNFVAAMFSFTICATFLKIFMNIVHFVRGR